MTVGATTDAAFDAFVEEQRLETLQRRREAIDQLLALGAVDVRTFDHRRWKAATALLKHLHAQAWLHEPRVLPPNRIVPWPTVSRAHVASFLAELRRGLTRLFPIKASEQSERRIWSPP